MAETRFQKLTPVVCSKTGVTIERGYYISRYVRTVRYTSQGQLEVLQYDSEVGMRAAICRVFLPTDDKQFEVKLDASVSLEFLHRRRRRHAKFAIAYAEITLDKLAPWRQTKGHEIRIGGMKLHRIHDTRFF